MRAHAASRSRSLHNSAHLNSTNQGQQSFLYQYNILIIYFVNFMISGSREA